MITTVTALALVATAASVAGTAVAVAGAQEQAAAAKKSGEYNQKVAENNAEASRQQAMFEADKISRRNRMILGRQKAVIAKSGILDTGSTLDVLEDSAVQGEMDRLAALYSGEVRSNYYQSQGQLASMEGNSQARANYYRSAGTLLTGASSVAGSYYNNTRNNGPTFSGSSGGGISNYED